MSRFSPLVMAACLAVPAANVAIGQEPSPDQVISAMEDNAGVNPGQRRNHIKGTCASGEFVGAPEAKALSKSALFSGSSVPVTARFSLPGGNPKLPDTARTVRGMALQFQLGKSEVQNMAMLNTPVFAVAAPQAFYENLLANKPDPATGKPDPEKQKAFREAHPEGKAMADFMAKNNPPPSYVNATYYSIHTFKFVDAAGKATPVRWRFVPQAGEKQLTDDELKTLPPDFLEARLIEATAAAPQRWDMIVTVGQPGDPETDATKAWPADRRSFKAGELTIKTATPQKGAPCEALNFDPMNLAAGIEASDDAILMFRSPAYAVSYSKRLDGK